MRKSVFKKFIDSLKEDELREELEKIFDKIPKLKEYYAMELGSEAERKKVFDKAKKTIDRYYRTKSYRKPKAPRIRYIQNLLRDISEISIFDHEMADLYLYDTEKALEFMGKYYFSSQSLNNNVTRSFQSANEIILAGGFQHLFEKRINEILLSARRIPEIYMDFNKIYIKVYR